MYIYVCVCACVHPNQLWWGADVSHGQRRMQCHLSYCQWHHSGVFAFQPQNKINEWSNLNTVTHQVVKRGLRACNFIVPCIHNTILWESIGLVSLEGFLQVAILLVKILISTASMPLLKELSQLPEPIPLPVGPDEDRIEDGQLPEYGKEQGVCIIHSTAIVILFVWVMLPLMCHLCRCHMCTDEYRFFWLSMSTHHLSSEMHASWNCARSSDLLVCTSPHFTIISVTIQPPSSVNYGKVAV